MDDLEATHACVLICFSCVLLFATLWTVPHQAPLSLGFSRQEYWNGLLCPPPGDTPIPRIEPVSVSCKGGFFTTHYAIWEAIQQTTLMNFYGRILSGNTPTHTLNFLNLETVVFII